MDAEHDRWPDLPYQAWRETAATLQLWTQIVGKVRLALAPWVNHSWQVPLYVTARGLTTSAMPYAGEILELEFDFIQPRLLARTSRGEERCLALAPQTVADFYARVMELLRELKVAPRAPLHLGGAPGLADAVIREAYSHEVSSAGFWPGSESFPRAAFYSYAYPEPAGFPGQAMTPPAYYDKDLGEFILPYEEARRAADPEAVLLDFLTRTYTAADGARWDRAALECAFGLPGQVRPI